MLATGTPEELAEVAGEPHRRSSCARCSASTASRPARPPPLARAAKANGTAQPAAKSHARKVPARPPYDTQVTHSDDGSVTFPRRETPLNRLVGQTASLNS